MTTVTKSLTIKQRIAKYTDEALEAAKVSDQETVDSLSNILFYLKHREYKKVKHAAGGSIPGEHDAILAGLHVLVENVGATNVNDEYMALLETYMTTHSVKKVYVVIHDTLGNITYGPQQFSLR